jgi:hypothetical protein
MVERRSDVVHDFPVITTAVLTDPGLDIANAIA